MHGYGVAVIPDIQPGIQEARELQLFKCSVLSQEIVCIGAAEVDLFDREPRALQCALLTAAASGLSPLTSAASFSVTSEEKEALLRLQEQLKAGNVHVLHQCKVTASEFDWHQPFSGQPYDVVIACDVLYDASAVSPLATLLPCMLGPGAEVYGWNRLILTDPPERTPHHREDFLAKLAAQHPDMVVEFTSSNSVDEHGVSGSVLIMALRRKAPGGGDTIGGSPTSIR